MTDQEIKSEWYKICRQYARNSLGRRIALLRADALEASGVTEADIDRIFPPQQAAFGDNPELAGA